jgi:hypothetical protein
MNSSELARKFREEFDEADKLRNRCKLFDYFDRPDPTFESWEEVSSLFRQLARFEMDPDSFIIELLSSTHWKNLPGIIADPTRFFHLERITDSVEAALNAVTPIAPVDPDVLHLTSAGYVIRQTVADVQRGMMATGLAHVHGLLAALTRRLALRDKRFGMLTPLQMMMDEVRHFASTYPCYLAFARRFQHPRSLIAAYRYRRYADNQPHVAQFRDMRASWGAAVDRAGGWRGPPAPPLRMGFDRFPHWVNHTEPPPPVSSSTFAILPASTTPPSFYRVRIFDHPGGSPANPFDVIDELKWLGTLDYPCMLRYPKDPPTQLTEIRSEFSTTEFFDFHAGVGRSVERTDRLKWIIAMLFGLLYLHGNEVAHGRLGENDGITFDPMVRDKLEDRRRTGSGQLNEGIASELVLSGFGLYRFTAHGRVTGVSRRESFYQREKADVEAFARRVEEIAEPGGGMTPEARTILERCRQPSEGTTRMKDVRRLFAEIRFRVFDGGVDWAAIDTFLGSLPECCHNWDHLFTPLSEGNGK